MMHKLQNILTIPNKQAKLALIGAIMVKFGMGGIMTWGQISIYFFSYFYNKDNNTNIALASTAFNFAAIPVAVCMLFSVKIAQKVTYRWLIRVAAIVYPAGILVSSFITNIWFFLAVYLLFAICAFGCVSLPIINCLWSHFPHAPGKVTGIALFSHGIASFLYAIIAVEIINPHNYQTSIHINNDGNSDEGITLYGTKVSSNVPLALIILGLVYAAFTIPGSFLISHKQEQFNTKKHNKSNDQQQNTENNNSNVEIELKEIEDPDKKLNKDAVLGPSNVSENPQNLTLKQAIFSPPFLIISGVTFSISLFGFFLSINYKLAMVQKIDDDTFLTMIGSIAVLAGAAANIFWGIIGDKYEFKKVYFIVVICYAFLAITFIFISKIKILMALYFIGIAVLNAGLFTLVAPALIGFFGMKIGQQILPCKTLSMFAAILILPVFNYWAIDSGSYDTVFFILGLFQLAGVALAFILKPKYIFESKNNKNDDLNSNLNTSNNDISTNTQTADENFNSEPGSEL